LRQNVGWGQLDLREKVFLPNSFNIKEKRSILRVNDALLNIVGASIGRCAVVTAEAKDGNVNQAVVVIRPSMSIVEPKYSIASEVGWIQLSRVV
jgi:type I restriction enzyme S subunit